WLSARGISRFHLVGHSFGGLVALSLAAANPSSVSSLTVASAPALGLPAEAKALLATRALDVAARWAARLPVSKRVMGGYLRWMRGGGPVPPEALSLYAESAAADGYFPGMADALRSIASYRLPVDALRGAPFRTTVLWGERDPLVPVVQGEQLAGALGAQLRVLHDVGHCVPEERPDAIHDGLG
ncbi:MAG: alpha/beta fold hydrolase, partial [Archangium sp.]|nr:alpha/beta fold hydrolase [Archangium sp.]